jgi:hypothetical protein
MKIEGIRDKIGIGEYCFSDHAVKRKNDQKVD